MGKPPLGGPGMRPDLDMTSALDLRLATMDAQAIDIEALSINPNWYQVGDRDLAAEIIRVQNEALAEACAATPDRFVAFASVALQFPDLAAQQRFWQEIKPDGFQEVADAERTLRFLCGTEMVGVG